VKGVYQKDVAETVQVFEARLKDRIHLYLSFCAGSASGLNGHVFDILKRGVDHPDGFDGLHN
jgi:hypothetical protein